MNDVKIYQVIHSLYRNLFNGIHAEMCVSIFIL